MNNPVNNRITERRTMASHVRYLSILDRRCDVARRRVERTNHAFTLGSIGFPLYLVGIVASWVLFVSEVWK